MSDVTVTRNEEAKRWEAHVGGELAGFAEYQTAPDLVVFTHTEVDPAFEGQGVGSALARHALDEVRAQGSTQVLPICPFIKGWIHRHPEEYGDLLYGVKKSEASPARDRQG